MKNREISHDVPRIQKQKNRKKPPSEVPKGGFSYLKGKLTALITADRGILLSV